MTTLRNRTRSGIAILAAITLSGCDTGNPAHPSWPKPVRATALNQFDGVYRNHGHNFMTGRQMDNDSQLFDHLTDRPNDHGKRAWELEMRSSPDGRAVRLRLCDSHGGLLDSTELRSGVHYRFVRGSIALLGSSTGFQGGTSNLGTAIDYDGARLYLTPTGGLLCATSSSGAGLLFYMIPAAHYGKHWSYWTRLRP